MTWVSGPTSSADAGNSLLLNMNISMAALTRCRRSSGTRTRITAPSPVEPNTRAAASNWGLIWAMPLMIIRVQCGKHSTMYAKINTVLDP